MMQLNLKRNLPKGAPQDVSLLQRTPSEIEVEGLLARPPDDEDSDATRLRPQLWWCLIARTPATLDAMTFAYRTGRCHPVLCTIELVIHIFQFMSKAGLLASIEVCKAWWAVGNKILWQEHRMALSGMMLHLACQKTTWPIMEWDEVVNRWFLYPDTLGAKWKRKWDTWRNSRSNVVISMTLHIPTVTQSLRIVEEMIAAHGGPVFDHLKSLTIIIRSDAAVSEFSSGDDATMPSLSRILSPKVAHIEVEQPLQIDDGIVDIIARRLPGLETLCLVVQDDEQPVTSEQSLFSLATLCKLLTNLEIEISASPAALPQNVQPGDKFLSLSLLTAHALYTDPPDDVPRISADLGKLCPSVSELMVRRLHVERRLVDHWPLVEKFYEARRTR
ncbi:hypothetical protein FRB97_001908 [Tulasnella sp. 331]|nr:hypothetical protein FRB97_001908 [Tulasnella sp. 331]